MTIRDGHADAGNANIRAYIREYCQYAPMCVGKYWRKAIPNANTMTHFVTLHDIQSGSSLHQTLLTSVCLMQLPQFR